ncbi:BON domain-containing protein [Nocardia cyriacigeorgica]|uniref:BON domain-containing protein n=1 Tax=Nocardia cyriacigeorgica TaxID=135487 RepID=UPI00158C6C66|nr:BON domain-containing protein [Nocardia cyriacigeorgica]
MPDTTGEPESIPPQYLVARLHRALAEDPRTAELGVQIHIRGGVIVLDGEVTSAERKQQLENTVRELVPNAPIHNEVRVGSTAQPGPSEELR